MKKIRVLSLICIVCLLLCACSTKSATDKSYGNTVAERFDKGYDDYNSGSSSAPTGGASLDAMMPTAPDLSDKIENGIYEDSGKIPESERKLIKNGNFTLETLEYEKTIDAIEALITSVGGYIQNSNVSGTGSITSGGSQMRRANYTVRLPSGDFGSFEDGLSSCGSVLSRNVYVDEVTDYYYDSEARLSSLQTQEQQLLRLMEKAVELDAIIKLQSELSNVRYQIESLQGTLRRLDSQIAYSTVNITVREVYEPTIIQTPPKTLGERISYTFSNTWDNIVSSAEDFVVYVAGNILVLAFWAVIIVAAIIIIRRTIKRKKTSKMIINNEDTQSK